MKLAQFACSVYRPDRMAPPECQSRHSGAGQIRWRIDIKQALLVLRGVNRDCRHAAAAQQLPEGAASFRKRTFGERASRLDANRAWQRVKPASRRPEGGHRRRMVGEKQHLEVSHLDERLVT